MKALPRWMVLLLLLVLNACTLAQNTTTPTPIPPSPIPASGPKPPPAALQPAVGAWVLVEMPGTPIPPDATPTLLIGPSSFSGKAVCNTYHFQLEAREDGGWRFSFQEHTVVYCGDEEGAFEEAYWSALRRAQVIQREGDTLVMKDGSSQVLLRFRSQ
ncbi:MAG TPA: META domain-containing protein [Anaerolineae bacterium]|nr:META domain-containing protein [Anaerolineae bacterium]